MRKLILALFVFPLAALAAPMNNQDVITMVRSGLAEATVAQAIDASQPAFDTSANGLISLKNGGVSDALIQRIIARGSAAPAASAPAQPAAQVAAAAPACRDCGTVEAIRELDRPGQASGGGAVAGGIVGGLLGRQLAPDHRRAGTVLGAVGGAVAGHQIEKSAKSGKTWEVSVRFDDRSVRTYSQDTQPVLMRGDRVRVVDGALVRQ